MLKNKILKQRQKETDSLPGSTATEAAKPSSRDIESKHETAIQEKEGKDDRVKKKKREKGAVVKESAFSFLRRIQDDHLTAYAAEAAYFFILSFFPFLIFLTTLIRYTDLTYNMLSSTIRSIIPPDFQGFVMELVSEIYNRNSVVLPISAVFVLWSAGKAIQSLINGLNTIYHVKETRNWLINRINAVFYTMIFSVAITSSLVLLVLGNRIKDSISRYLPPWAYRIWHVLGGRSIVVGIVLFFLFVFLYHALPNRPATFTSQMPGAAIIAVSWSVFSFVFSMYFTFFPSLLNMYGSLTALILLMLWLYFLMNFVLIGAAINAHFEAQFRVAHETIRERIGRNH
ncbi:MAG: YihY/virulence factor BrkB family protein [Blautia sp.]|nr:YihY/virulence factor BrkB family protein [Blautia sp.]